MSPRVPALDALRGVLAVLVVVNHIAIAFGSSALEVPARVVVALFFAMSGYVLARAWDGQYLRFVIRRMIRLWPLHAACVTAGSLLLLESPPLGELVWWPGFWVDTMRLVNVPSWSVFVEAAATPVLPLMFLAARRGRVAALGVTAACALLIPASGYASSMFFFAIGVAGSSFPIRWPASAPRSLLWLGQISYSLYLSHAVVIRAVGPGLAVALVVPCALLVWRWIERPSIELSREAAAWCDRARLSDGPMAGGLLPGQKP
jgi:peptidoglycan/LPS O-acetylase OafA/YrhL